MLDRIIAGSAAPTTAQTKRSTGRKPLRRATFKAAASFVATGSLILASVGIGHADIITNDILSIDAVAKIMPLNVSGANGTTELSLITTDGDGKSGCNLTGKTVLTLNLVSSNPSVATVRPSTVDFTSCGFTQTLTVTPGAAAGEANITATQAANTTGTTFDLAPAAFTVKVAPAAPANTAPTLKITGTEPAFSYKLGSVPAAVCEVTDAEDGPSTKPATLSPITGPDNATGIGSQTASCSYTDKGGLTASGDVVYNIVDPTPPEITYILDPATPNGEAGWYKSDVTLKWTVKETESPVSFTSTGCEDQIITMDQQAKDYTCSASSSGGPAAPQTVSIKKDAAAPTVAYTEAAATAGSNGWYKSDVTALFTATDAMSGPAPATQTKASESEGAAVKVDSPEFKDAAGNIAAAGAASAIFKIDKTAPTVAFSSELGVSVYGSTPSAPTCTAVDSLSGHGSCVVSGYTTTVGIDKVLTATATDMAGNETTATQKYTVSPWKTNGFYQPVDMGGTLNTVKGGSTVPVKFEMFAGSTELTDPSQMSFSMAKTACSPTALTDEIETLAASSTSLRYDATAGHFVYNWKTPTGAATCYALSMKAADGTTTSALFKLK